MNFLNTKNVRIAALVTASINLLFALMTFVMISTMFSIASVASIIHWISMVFGIIILGYVLYSAFGLKQALSSSGKVFAVAQTIAVFLGVVWIAGLYGAMAATGSFISGLGGFLEYSPFDLIKKLLFYMGGGLGSVIFIFIIYMIANIVCILIAVKFNIFLVGADGVTPKRVKVEKLKLTDAEGKVIYLTKGEAAGMDLSNYTVETIEEDAVASEPVVDLSGAASTASSMVSSVAGVAGDVSSKAGSFLKTPKGKKTAIGGVIAVLLVVLGIIFIPKLFSKTLDLTDELDIQYKGISGKAMVSKISYNLDKVSDEDSKNFYKSISYYATPSFGLKNGDEIKIVASYSEFKAKQLGITIKNKEKTIKVDGLAEPFKEKDDVKKEFLKKLDESVNEKLEKWKEKLAGSLGNKDNIKPELEGIYLIPYKDERSADIGYVYTVKGQFPGIFRAPKDEDMTRVCTIIFRDVNDSVDVEKLIINTDEKELKEDIDKTVREMLLTRDLQKDLIKLN